MGRTARIGEIRDGELERRWLPPRTAAILTGLFVGAILLAGGEPASAGEPPAEATPAPEAEAGESRAAALTRQILARQQSAGSRVDAALEQVEAEQAGAKQRVAEVFEQIDVPAIPTRRAAPLHEHEAAAHANGTLFLQKPDPAAPATFVGTGGYSADGVSASLGANLRAELPAGSTPVQAFLYGYFLTGNPTPAEATVNFDGTPVTLTKLDDFSHGLLSSARADVTSQVAAKVGTSGGITNFGVTTGRPLDGLGLVVIYSNPALPEATIAVFDGAAQQTGDTATFTFDAPLDKTQPGFSARMSLGIGFSYQQASGHLCGPGSPVSMQYSVIDVNGSRLTTCAGGDDDTVTGGGLFTVGGVGDSINNPADPFQHPGDGNPVRVQDDELYNLEPFLNQGDTQLIVTTSQPSNDDILFLSVVQVAARARVTTEVCGDGIDNDGDGLVDGDDPDVDCPGEPPPPDEICDDGIDNDGDGLVDGDDPDCPVVSPPPPPDLDPLPPGVVAPPVPLEPIVAEVVQPAPVPPAPPAPSTAPASRRLPRTGDDPIWPAAGALVLLGLGTAALRRGRQDSGTKGAP